MRPDHFRALIAALLPAGEIYRDTGNPAKGCERFREADAIWTRLAKAGLLSKLDTDKDANLIKARLAKCA
jgi:hypothetical protein